MDFLKRIKEFFIKPEFHPESHDEKVAKIIDDISQYGLKKGSKKSAVEIQSIAGIERDSFCNYLEPTIGTMSLPGEYKMVAEASDRINMGLDEDRKERLRLTDNAIDALAAILYMEEQGYANASEINNALLTIYNNHTILPPHSEQVATLTKEISNKGLKKGSKKLQSEIGYLTHKTVDDFINQIKPKLASFQSSLEEEIVPIATQYLQMELDDDQLVRFRLEDNAMEAFATLIELENMSKLTDEEEIMALQEIFSHHTFLPSHDKQVEILIENICDSGMTKGSAKSKNEIKYLTGMTVDEFINYVKPDVDMAHQYDITEMLANASDLLNMNLDDEEKYLLKLEDDAIDAFAILGVLSQNDFLWDNEEELALKEIFKYHSFENVENE